MLEYDHIGMKREIEMDHSFWLERWEQGQIGFHQTEINQYLSEHWHELGLTDGKGWQKR